MIEIAGTQPTDCSLDAPCKTHVELFFPQNPAIPSQKLSITSLEIAPDFAQRVPGRTVKEPSLQPFRLAADDAFERALLGDEK